MKAAYFTPVRCGVGNRVVNALAGPELRHWNSATANCGAGTASTGTTGAWTAVAGTAERERRYTARLFAVPVSVVLVPRFPDPQFPWTQSPLRSLCCDPYLSRRVKVLCV